MYRRTPYPTRNRGLLLLLLAFIVPWALDGASAVAADRIRIAVLKFGTVNWEMDVIKRHRLDQEQGIDLEVVELAGKQATMVALQSGDVDIAVTDWIWVSRQRTAGRPFTFVPYSTAVGALVASPESGIDGLPDLKGRRLGIAGGPLDKSWLLFQALASRDFGMDLGREVIPVFGAPPLLNQQLLQGRIDAVINFWPYVARLRAAGMRPVMGVGRAAALLGLEADIPIIGYTFDQRWAEDNRQALQGFVRAISSAKTLLRQSDQEWLRLRPLMKADDDATFEALRDGFRAGIPRHWGAKEREEAEKLFAILRRVGGRRLVGDATRLAEGTFWPEVSY